MLAVKTKSIVMSKSAAAFCMPDYSKKQEIKLIADWRQHGKKNGTNICDAMAAMAKYKNNPYYKAVATTANFICPDSELYACTRNAPTYRRRSTAFPRAAGQYNAWTRDSMKNAGTGTLPTRGWDSCLLLTSGRKRTTKFSF